MGVGADMPDMPSPPNREARERELLTAVGDLGDAREVRVPVLFSDVFPTAAVSACIIVHAEFMVLSADDLHPCQRGLETSNHYR
jgi:hypothetical protein